jgi:hypothetical protein
MDVVAQQVWTTWTTRSRGAQVHRVDVDESTGFKPRFVLRPIGELDGVMLRERDDVLEVQAAAAPMGWPRRV